MMGIEGITFACDDPDRVADFWAGVLEGNRRELPASVDDVLVERPGERADLLFRDLPCGSREALAIHLDLHVEDRAAAEDLLVARGASVRERKSETFEGHTGVWTVLEDPVGNGFCISEY